PDDDAEFPVLKGETRRYATSKGAPAGRVDLLTALMHEMGHPLGFADTYDPRDRDSIMYGWLTVGERRAPAKGQAMDPGGVSDGSRRLSEAIPPVSADKSPPTPEGSQRIPLTRSNFQTGNPHRDFSSTP